MSLRRSARAPPAVADHTASSGDHAHVTHGHRDAERQARGEAGARIAVGRQRDGHSGVDHPTCVRIGRPGRELSAGQQRGDRVARGEQLQVVVASCGCSGRRTPRRPRPRRGCRRRAAAGWRGCAARGRRPMPAVRIARAWSASNAPRSQNTSIHRACGAHAASIVADDERDVVVCPSGELRGHDVRAEVGRLRGELRRDSQRTRLVGDGQPVSGLRLEGGDAARPQLAGQTCEVRCAARRHRRRGSLPRWCGCRRPRTAGRSCARRTPPRDRPRRPDARGCRRSPAARSDRRGRCDGRSSPQSLLRPDPRDLAVLDDNRGVGDQPEWRRHRSSDRW